MAKHLRHLGWSFGAVLITATTAWAGFGDPLPGLSDEQQARFEAGLEEFSEVEVVATGLGPIFNEASCATCHTTASGAIGGNTTRVETRFGRTTANVFDPLVNRGGSLLQDHAIGRGDASAGLPDIPRCQSPQFQFVPEVVPPPATIVAGRRTTPLFGLGLVDAVSDQTLIALAAQEQNDDPATAGSVSFVIDADSGQTVVGRFGWKAQHGRLHAFAGEAYLNEMGITNPSFPDENCPRGNCTLLVCNPVPDLNDDGDDVIAFTDFMQLLAAPPRGPNAPGAGAGEQIFENIGCAKCHRPTLQSGPSPIAALSNRTFHPYSDFLLHDMGSLGDGITQNNATGRLMRTAPLWGISIQQTLLHDGRATTVRDAILAHEGQGAAARAAFLALNSNQQQRLLSFIATL